MTGAVERPDDAVGKTASGGRRLVRHQRKAPEQGIDSATPNAILIKVNQIGSLTETLETVEMAHRPPIAV